jgi:hypothetical protein
MAKAPAPKTKMAETEAPGALDGALGALDGADIGNRESLHSDMGDMHEADAHFDGDVHVEDDDFEWEPTNQLDAPDPRPGYTQRWVRMNLVGKPDARNQSYSDHQGWKPRRLETVPEGDRKRYPTIADAKHGGIITNGELVLCEMPAKRAESRRQYFRDKSRRQTDSLLTEQIAQSERNARGGFHAMEVTERKTRVTTRRPIVAADR